METNVKKKLTAREIQGKTVPAYHGCRRSRNRTVTTSAILGANYEYGMVRMVCLALLARGIYMRSAYTAQIVLGMPVLDCINAYYGKTWRHSGLCVRVWLRSI